MDPNEAPEALKLMPSPTTPYCVHPIPYLELLAC